MEIKPEDFRVMLRPDLRRDRADISRLDPGNACDRGKLRFVHPLRRRRYLIPTTPNLEAFANTARIVDQSQSGAIFYAKTRFGKSSAQRYLALILKKLAPHATLIQFVAKTRKNSSPNNAYLDLAYHLGINTSFRPPKLFGLIIRAIWMRAAEEGSDDILLDLDEGQRYSEEEYDGLMNIGNALEDEWGFRVTTFIWGQRSLDTRRRSFLKDRDDIVERLMPWPFNFHGLTSPGDLQQTLAKLDTCSEFPVGSGRNFLWMFHPAAVDNGLHASHFAEPLWNEFMAAVKKEDRARIGRLGIGMNWISLAIEDLFTQHADDDHSKWRPSKRDFVDAVASSGFSEALLTSYSSDVCRDDDGNVEEEDEFDEEVNG